MIEGLKGTYTEENLKKAMQGEALAFIKYQIYASLLGNISKDLEEKINHIAHNEKEHFKVWAKLLYGEEYYDDKKNLLDAIMGENYECEDMYVEFARIAREEGFQDIANKFDQVAKIECNHSCLFKDFLKFVEESVDKKENEKGFICLNCGYIHNEKSIPDECPVCNHPKKYFVRID